MIFIDPPKVNMIVSNKSDEMERIKLKDNLDPRSKKREKANNTGNVDRSGTGLRTVL